jgi:hypothetical protein
VLEVHAILPTRTHTQRGCSASARPRRPRMQGGMVSTATARVRYIEMRRRFLGWLIFESGWSFGPLDPWIVGLFVGRRPVAVRRDAHRH